MAAREAVSSISAKAMSEKGMAEFTNPRIKNPLQCVLSLGRRPMIAP
jgi:hypothetical protein